jgi:hypothetical protein
VFFGKNVTTEASGSGKGLYLTVSDIESARDRLIGRRAEVGVSSMAGNRPRPVIPLARAKKWRLAGAALRRRANQP